MTADFIVALLRANLAASAAITLVLALGRPARRAFGAHLGYALWLVVPAAAAGALMPAPSQPAWGPALANVDDASRAWLAAGRHAELLAGLWAAGFAASLALALWRQARFAAAARAGLAGPAVVGVLAPRLVSPADFAERHGEAERRLIRAHERAHIDRQDGRATVLATAAVWACWFNPLAHLALAAFRRDQELACDATVMARLPGARRAYAEALLASHPAARRAVFGCHWLTLQHPLAGRLEMLARRTPSLRRRDLGLAALVALTAASFAAAWAAQPAAPQRAVSGPTVIVTELTPPDVAEAAWVQHWWPQPTSPR